MSHSLYQSPRAGDVSLPVSESRRRWHCLKCQWEKHACWHPVQGYSRKVWEIAMVWNLCFSMESAKHGFVVDLQKHIFSVRWVVFIFLMDSKDEVSINKTLALPPPILLPVDDSQVSWPIRWVYQLQRTQNGKFPWVKGPSQSLKSFSVWSTRRWLSTPG